MKTTDFKDKVILITGAGKGAGRILAEAFAERGAIVAANDVSPINVEEVVKGIVARGGRAKVYVDDVAKKMAVQALVKQVEDDFGRIDILINHASVEPHTPLLDMDEWDWRRVMDVNLTGTFLMMQSVGRVMREQGGGAVVNLITGTGRRVQDDAGAFMASMGGLISLTQSAARELDPYGIRVNGVLALEAERMAEVVFELCLSNVNGKIADLEAK